MSVLSDNAERFCQVIVAYYGASITKMMSQPDQTYLDRQIRRYSDISKSGDKISGSAMQAAYDYAMDFLTKYRGLIGIRSNGAV